MLETALLVAAVLAALSFSFVNGMTDAPHAFAPPVRTGALTPRIAVGLSAGFTALGALLSTGLATTLGSLISIPTGPAGLLLLFAGAGGAAAWGLIAHWAGMPTSSTQGLASALLGAALAAEWTGHPLLLIKPAYFLAAVVLPLLLSPWLAFGAASVVAYLSVLSRRQKSAHQVHRNARLWQAVVSTMFATVHGVQDGQRTGFLLTAVLMTAGISLGSAQPAAVIATSALVLGVGALFGSWRIARTLSHRMTRLDPITASIGSGTAATLLFGGLMLQLPLSSSQLSTMSLVGAAQVSPFRPTDWRTVLSILLFWVATIPGAALLGSFIYLVFSGLI